MRKRKQNCGVYAYLESTGVLQNGSENDIVEAKKKYWAWVRKEWKKSKRSQSKSVTVFFNVTELKKVSAVAKKMHLAKYVKQAALACSNNRVIVDKIAVGEIRQLLILLYINIQNLTEEHVIPKNIAAQLLLQVREIEVKTMEQMRQA